MSYNSFRDRLARSLDSKYVAYSLLFVMAILTRFMVFGNPFIFADEEFYMLVGGRMLHGELPYVDIWDRKPIGIFLLYELFHLFGPYRIWAYQAIALLSAWATSILCMKVARLIAPVGGALCAGCLYLVWIANSQGCGGQTPIFYNLLVVWAILLVARFMAGQARLTLFQTGAGVMLLFGIALQLKTSVVFEGIYVGLFLMGLTYRQGGTLKQVMGHAIIWCGLALVPTLAVMLFYALDGHFQEWWFANTVSIFLKKPIPAASLHQWLHNVYWCLVMLGILLGTTVLRFLFKKQTAHCQPLSLFLGGWAWTAFAGFALFNTFTKHYSLPLYPAFFITAAPLWASPFSRLWLVLLLVWGGIRTYDTEKKINRASDLSTLRQAVSRLSSPVGCVFNYDTPDILLDSVPYCHLTRFPFSAHLSTDTERNALGIDPVQETEAILAQKPLYILLSADDTEHDMSINRDTYAVLTRELKQHYEMIYEHPPRYAFSGFIIYRRIR
ncbi:ArnT family glycosyltransferase [Bombella apis]|uniref:Glycosyltransferase RgtA/B/C/D-like domain-containing protein n=1 Tax=Bombella apis TaxID=1785988 RepID=A0ABR9MSA0_9PROT|nr:hypothetical protein [Bombella apis]MBE1724394.1 hypothetical protein [Bombella apis]MBR9729813.1 hypothetical protein [Bombella apis]